MRAGILQASGSWGDFDARLDALETALAAEPDLNLLLCPELFVSGYFMSADECQKAAQPQDGPYRSTIGALAHKHQTAIVYGYPEAAGNHIYNAAACVDQSGTLIANHRKLALPPGFERDRFTTGSQQTVFALNGFRCAILICYDAEFPEAVRAAAMAGANCILVPTALTDNWPVVAHKIMPTRAFENGVWLLYANSASDHTNADGSMRLCGLSAIVRPDGSDAARAAAHPQLISATLDQNRVHDAQKRLPYLTDCATLKL